MEKVFTGCLMVNWKTGRLSIYKKKPKTIPPSGIPINVMLKVVIPEQQQMELKGEIEVMQSKVREIFLDSV